MFDECTAERLDSISVCCPETNGTDAVESERDSSHETRLERYPRRFLCQKSARAISSRSITVSDADSAKGVEYPATSLMARNMREAAPLTKTGVEPRVLKVLSQFEDLHRIVASGNAESSSEGIPAKSTPGSNQGKATAGQIHRFALKASCARTSLAPTRQSELWNTIAGGRLTVTSLNTWGGLACSLSLGSP